jgi:hypothetical protein
LGKQGIHIRGGRSGRLPSTGYKHEADEQYREDDFYGFIHFHLVEASLGGPSLVEVVFYTIIYTFFGYRQSLIDSHSVQIPCLAWKWPAKALPTLKRISSQIGSNGTFSMEYNATRHAYKTSSTFGSPSGVPLQLSSSLPGYRLVRPVERLSSQFFEYLRHSNWSHSFSNWIDRRHVGGG